VKVSTRGEYGMRAMVELSRRFGDGPTPLATIADSSRVPAAYLEHLMRDLRNEHIVKSTRGAHGGYELTRAPQDILVGEVYRALEGPVAPMDCVSEIPVEDVCPLIDGCATRVAWVKVRDSIIDVLDSTSLADLLAEARPTQTAIAGSA
jgi:Rrf2 family cysteine metabolism transcriptional repressor